MSSLLNKCRQFLKSEEAPTATEYAVMLALIIVVAIVAISLLGSRVSESFNNAANALPTGS